jgi:hypothetical protein
MSSPTHRRGIPQAIALRRIANAPVPDEHRTCDWTVALAQCRHLSGWPPAAKE